jgi:Arc/MetJ family transcription regulator
MPTNLAIDDRLLQEALQVGRLHTKKETATKALEEFIERRRQRKILKAFHGREARCLSRNRREDIPRAWMRNRGVYS